MTIWRPLCGKTTFIRFLGLLIKAWHVKKVLIKIFFFTQETWVNPSFLCKEKCTSSENKLYRVDLSSSGRRQACCQKLFICCLIARVYGIQFKSYKASCRYRVHLISAFRRLDCCRSAGVTISSVNNWLWRFKPLS